ncbi:hypothetical protein ABPG74_021290 [Tetrahymena malaccensis]
MDFNQMSNMNCSQQLNDRQKTAQFGLQDLLSEEQYQQSPITQTKSLAEDYLTRPRSQNQSQTNANNSNNLIADSKNSNQHINYSINDSASQSSGSNNIVSALIPNIVYDIIHHYWQKEPLQQNEQQQKQVIKKIQKDEAPKFKPQSHQNDYRHQLIDLGVKDKYILNGEQYIKDIQAGLKSATFRLEGKLILTNFKLIYVVTNGKYESLGSPDFYQIQLMMIQSCERTVEKKGNQFSYIDIECKDVRKYQFRFNFDQNEESQEFMGLLIDNAFNKEIHKYPAFIYKKYNEEEQLFNGWNIYNIKKEFERMRINIHDPTQQNTNSAQEQIQYYYKYLNNELKDICETYPPYLVVPYYMQEETIKKCSKFRSRERLPVLTFGFKSSNEQKLPVTLWRCSQCRTGFSSRSTEDEQMLRLIGDPTNKDNRISNNVNVHIYDARPFMNAVGNKLAGKGYESNSCYKNCDIQFLDIHNIHKVRDSYNKLVSVCLSSDQQIKWFKEVDSSQWLEHISTIIQGAVRICQSMLANNHVVVHCSDGWDRTSQLCSLAQIFLDPYYRTIEGFCTLVQKDWVYFGHQFNLRQGHGQRNQSEETSPIFLQFLDCVHQVQNYYPLSFEFNEQFLVDLAFSSYNCQYGTFLANSYQELVRQNIVGDTISVWSSLLSKKHIYENPFYKKDNQIQILKPDFQQRSLKIWNRYFFFYQFQRLDEYKIEQQKCRFNEDNIQTQHKRSQDALQFYEQVLKELKIQMPKQRVTPKDIANLIKQSIIKEYETQQVYKQDSEQYEEDYDFILKQSSHIVNQNSRQNMN